MYVACLYFIYIFLIKRIQMMFSRRSSLPSCPSFSTAFETSTLQYKTDERGFVTAVLVSDSDCPLPDPSDYSIESLIRSGVPLQETKTSILPSRIEDVLDVDFEPEFSEIKTSEIKTPEVKD